MIYVGCWWKDWDPEWDVDRDIDWEQFIEINSCWDRWIGFLGMDNKMLVVETKIEIYYREERFIPRQGRSHLWNYRILPSNRSRKQNIGINRLVINIQKYILKPRNKSYWLLSCLANQRFRNRK